MAKVRVAHEFTGYKSYYWKCPACGYSHTIDVRTDGGQPSWGFNGDMDRPTFTPSVRVRSGLTPTEGTCHFFIEDGKIRFLADCSHELAGKTVEMEDVDEKGITCQS